MPDAPVFVDTNVIIYASRRAADHHAAAVEILSRLRRDGVSLWVSRQVFREYLAAATRRQSSGTALPMSVAVADVRELRGEFNLAEESDRVFDRLLELLAAHPGGGKQVHDANLVATMLEHGITRLLTFNGSDFHRFGNLIEVVAPGSSSDTGAP